MKVYILRGFPGAGKTYFARALMAKLYQETINVKLVSADHYFMIRGEYRFDVSKLGQAHTFCMQQFLHETGTMRREHIIVDNTNIRLMEVNPYRMVALAHGYEVEVIRVAESVAVCAGRNIHNVPLLTIQKMYRNYEVMPDFFGGERSIESGESL